ncbi:M10 family metallopeptidase C-terminal domain-containing protein, partial [Cylindrospermopsis raciborskii]
NDIFYLGVNGRAIGGEGDDRFFVGEGGGNIISGGAGADQFWILTDDPTKLKASNTIVDYTIGTDVIGITNQVANSKGDLTFSGSDISLNGVLIATLNGVNAAGATFVFANPLAS